MLMEIEELGKIGKCVTVKLYFKLVVVLYNVLESSDSILTSKSMNRSAARCLKILWAMVLSYPS